MPRVDESRAVKELDLLYALLKKRDDTLKEVGEENKALWGEVLELREVLKNKEYELQEALTENEATKKALLENRLAKQQLEALYCSESLVPEPIDVSEASSPQLSEIEYLKRRVDELEEELNVCKRKVGSEDMLLDLKEKFIKDQESIIKRLKCQVSFLASAQNDSSGSCANFFDKYFAPAERIHPQDPVRLSKRFRTEKITNECQRCHKPIPTGEEFFKCRYHNRNPLPLFSWSKMDNYKSYAMQPEKYSKHLLWPCCDLFSRQAGRGCMTNMHHDVMIKRDVHNT